MTQDELIEATARAIGQIIEGPGEDMGAEWYGRPLWRFYVGEARAALIVIAPAVLEEAEQRCRYVAKHNYDQQEEGPYREGFEIACEVCETSISGLKASMRND